MTKKKNPDTPMKKKMNKIKKKKQLNESSQNSSTGIFEMSPEVEIPENELIARKDILTKKRKLEKLDSGKEFTSPKRKKSEIQSNSSSSNKNNSHLDNDDSVQEPKEESAPEEEVWTKEEDIILLQTSLSFIKKISKISYRSELNKLNYADLSEALHNKSPEACKFQLSLLLEGVKKHKSLFQILTEAEEGYEKFKNKKPLSGFSKYYKVNIEAVRQAYTKLEGEGKVTNQMTHATTMWKNLTEEDRNLYRLDTDLKKPKRQLKIMDGEVCPLDVFINKQLEKGLKCPHAEYKKNFANLTDKKKIRYIAESVKSLEGRQMVEDDSEGNKVFYVKKWPSVDDCRLYLKYVNAPVINGCKYTYYLDERKPIEGEEVPASKKKLMYAMAQFKLLPELKQTKWSTRYNEVVENFILEVPQWKEDQSPIVCQMYDKMYPNFSKLQKRREIGFGKSTRSRSTKYTFYEVPMPNVLMNFDDSEPTVPPTTALEVYVYEATKKNGGKKPKVAKCRELYNNLSEDSVQRLNAISIKMMMGYKKEVCNFVHSMSKADRQYYLGLRRKKLVNLFKEDLFEEDYPNKIYPVFLKKIKNIKKEAQSINIDVSFLNKSIAELKDSDFECTPRSPMKKVHTANEQSESDEDNIKEEESEDENQEENNESEDVDDIKEEVEGYDTEKDDSDEDEASDEDEDTSGLKRKFNKPFPKNNSSSSDY